MMKKFVHFFKFHKSTSHQILFFQKDLRLSKFFCSVEKLDVLLKRSSYLRSAEKITVGLLSKIWFLIFFISLNGASVFGQTGTVRGFVYSKETGEPVLFTPVFLEGTLFGTSTDHNGF